MHLLAVAGGDINGLAVPLQRSQAEAATQLVLDTNKHAIKPGFVECFGKRRRKYVMADPPALQVAIELGGPDLIVVASDGEGEVGQARLHELATRLPYKGSR